MARAVRVARERNLAVPKVPVVVEEARVELQFRPVLAELVGYTVVVAEVPAEARRHQTQTAAVVEMELLSLPIFRLLRIPPMIFPATATRAH